MNKIATLIISAVMVSVLSVGTVFAATPTLTKCPDQGILGFPAWFNGLKCKVDTGKTASDKTVTPMPTSLNDTWIIVLNILQWLMLAAGYLAAYFIIWSGFKYILAAGDPQKITSAKDTLLNAVIGLIIVFAAVAIVRTIQAGIGGNVI